MGAFKALFATCWRAPPQYGSAATHRHQPRDERELSTQQPHAASGAVQHTRAADGDSVKVDATQAEAHWQNAVEACRQIAHDRTQNAAASSSTQADAPRPAPLRAEPSGRSFSSRVAGDLPEEGALHVALQRELSRKGLMAVASSAASSDSSPDLAHDAGGDRPCFEMTRSLSDTVTTQPWAERHGSAAAPATAAVHIPDATPGPLASMAELQTPGPLASMAPLVSTAPADTTPGPLASTAELHTPPEHTSSSDSCKAVAAAEAELHQPVPAAPKSHTVSILAMEVEGFAGPSNPSLPPLPSHLLERLRSTFNNMCINYGVHKVNVSGEPPCFLAASARLLGTHDGPINLDMKQDDDGGDSAVQLLAVARGLQAAAKGRLRLDIAQPLPMRIGVATGICTRNSAVAVSGVFDAITAALHLQRACPLGSIQISQHTHSLLATGHQDALAEWQPVSSADAAAGLASGASGAAPAAYAWHPPTSHRRPSSRLGPGARACPAASGFAAAAPAGSSSSDIRTTLQALPHLMQIIGMANPGNANLPAASQPKGASRLSRCHTPSAMDVGGGSAPCPVQPRPRCAASRSAAQLTPALNGDTRTSTNAATGAAPATGLTSQGQGQSNALGEHTPEVTPSQYTPEHIAIKHTPTKHTPPQHAPTQPSRSSPRRQPFDNVSAHIMELFRDPARARPLVASLSAGSLGRSLGLQLPHAPQPRQPPYRQSLRLPLGHRVSGEAPASPASAWGSGEAHASLPVSMRNNSAYSTSGSGEGDPSG